MQVPEVDRSASRLVVGVCARERFFRTDRGSLKGMDMRRRERWQARYDMEEGWGGVQVTAEEKATASAYAAVSDGKIGPPWP